MTEIVDVLRQEHGNIEKLLRVLEMELNVFDRSGRPDYEVMRAVIDYFADYPDSCHHPKEDVIFAKLKARDPAAAAAVGNLEAEHEAGAKRLRRVAQAIEAILNDQDLMRDEVDAIIRDFIDQERQHIAMEERFFFPAALKALQPADWADVASDLASRRDPLKQSGVEGKYAALMRTILELEEQAEAERPNKAIGVNA